MNSGALLSGLSAPGVCRLSHTPWGLTSWAMGSPSAPGSMGVNPWHQWGAVGSAHSPRPGNRANQETQAKCTSSWLPLKAGLSFGADGLCCIAFVFMHVCVCSGCVRSSGAVLYLCYTPVAVYLQSRVCAHTGCVTLSGAVLWVCYTVAVVSLQSWCVCTGCHAARSISLANAFLVLE